MEGYDAIDMLRRLSQSLPPIQSFILKFFYVLGFGLAGSAIWGLVISGRSMAPTERVHYLRMLVAGTLMIGLTTTVDTVTDTFFRDTDPAQVLSYIQDTDPQKVVIQMVISIMILIGWIANGYGLWLVSSRGANGYSQVSKGLVHMVGGTFSICIAKLAQVLGESMGILDTVNAIL